MAMQELDTLKTRKAWSQFNLTDTWGLENSSTRWAKRYLEEEKANQIVRDFLETTLPEERTLILDIGSNLFAETYLPKGKQMVYLDWTDRGLPGLGCRVMADAQRLPFADTSFPVVFSKQLYGYLKDPGMLLAEMVRVLQKGGWFILIDFEGEIARYVQNPEVFRTCDFRATEVVTTLGQLGLRETQIKCLQTWQNFAVQPQVRIDFTLTAIVGRKR